MRRIGRRKAGKGGEDQAGPTESTELYDDAGRLNSNVLQCRLDEYYKQNNVQVPPGGSSSVVRFYEKKSLEELANLHDDLLRQTDGIPLLTDEELRVPRALRLHHRGSMETVSLASISWDPSSGNLAKGGGNLGLEDEDRGDSGLGSSKVDREALWRVGVYHSRDELLEELIKFYGERNNEKPMDEIEAVADFYSLEPLAELNMALEKQYGTGAVIPIPPNCRPIIPRPPQTEDKQPRMDSLGGKNEDSRDDVTNVL